MPQYDVPGVYIEEVSSANRPIEGASTTVTAFLGVAPNAGAFVDEPRACNNWSEFVRDFMPPDSKPTPLAYAAFAYFATGGRRLYVSNIGAAGTIVGDARKGSGIHALESYDEVSMLAAPGYTGADVYRALIDAAESRNQFAILDCVQKVDDAKELTEVGTVDAPAAGGDAPAGGGGGRTRKSKGKRPPDSKHAACYYPWIVMADPFVKGEVVVPPSGHMAGIYANNDYERGVHKAPANYAVRTAIGLSQRVSREQQSVLNAAGVNCIRFFPNSGIRVWGARTLSLTDPEWRYINVRRLITMLERSIEGGTQWVVFEPNDQSTRNSVAFNIRAFLLLQWRAGALVGASPEQAFFVKCDAENNPAEVVDAGRLVCEIGIAPVKPAEFIIFRIAQWSGGSEVQAA